MNPWLPPAHLVLMAAVVVWDVVTAGRIAQWRRAPRTFALISGLAGFLAVPAVLIGIATATSLAGAAALRVDWVWPATAALFAVQAAVAAARRFASPLWSVPIAAYDFVVAAAELVRYASAHGAALPLVALTPLAMERGALAFAISPAAIASPVFLLVPIMAPALPSRHRATGGGRVMVTGLAVLWCALFAAEAPVAHAALASYALHEDDPLRERPDADFAIGLGVLPAIGPAPQPAVLRADVGLADSLIVDAVGIVVTPSATGAALDSVSRAVQGMRRDSTLLIVTIETSEALFPAVWSAEPPGDRGLDAVRRVARRMHPDIVFIPIATRLPATGTARVAPSLAWREYLTRVVRAAKREDTGAKVGVLLSRYDAEDSALYAWAVSPTSPIEAVGLSLLPTRRGAGGIDAHSAAVDRWMFTLQPTTEHWVFAGGYPLAHGERNQQHAIWDALAWATDRAVVKGVIVATTGDYGDVSGLRSPFGRLRPATYAITRAIRGLRQPALP